MDSTPRCSRQYWAGSNRVNFGVSDENRWITIDMVESEELGIWFWEIGTSQKSRVKPKSQGKSQKY